MYSTVHYRPSISPPYIIQSTTDTETVIRVFYSPLQTSIQSSVYYTVNCSTCAPYIQSTTDPVPVLRILYSPPQTHLPVLRIFYNPLQTHYRSSVYTKSTTVLVSVLRTLYSHLQTRYQSSVYSTVPYSPHFSTPYTLQSTTVPVPFLCI